MFSIGGKLDSSGSRRRRRGVPRSLACWTRRDSRASWASMQGNDGLKRAAADDKDDDATGDGSNAGAADDAREEAAADEDVDADAEGAAWKAAVASDRGDAADDGRWECLRDAGASRRRAWRSEDCIVRGGSLRSGRREGRAVLSVRAGRRLLVEGKGVGEACDLAAALVRETRSKAQPLMACDIARPMRWRCDRVGGIWSRLV